MMLHYLAELPIHFCQPKQNQVLGGAAKVNPNYPSRCTTL